jgi:hypothetical protein
VTAGKTILPSRVIGADGSESRTSTGSFSQLVSQLAPILERLGVNGDGWVETVRHFFPWFKTAASRRDSLARLAARRSKAWLNGQSAAALAFR